MDLHKQIKNAITVGQHCQRNWDLTKEVPQSDIDLMIHSVTQCPSKQNVAFYKVHVIQDRDLIEAIHNETCGFRLADGELTTNPQVLANVLFAFEKTDHSSRSIDKNNLDEDGKLETIERDRQVAVGVAAGMLNLTSNLMGYRTGCCQCFNTEKVTELIGAENEVMLMMGCGIHKEGTNRLTHHSDHSKKFYSIKKEPIKVKKHAKA